MIHPPIHHQITAININLPACIGTKVSTIEGASELHLLVLAGAFLLFRLSDTEWLPEHR